MRIFKKKIADFQEIRFFTKLKTFKTHFFICIIHKPSLWSRDVPQKIGPDRFSRFDVYWIQTNKQTDKSNLYIDEWKSESAQKAL